MISSWLDGAVLAAIAADDRLGERGAAGLTPDLADPLRARLEALAALDAAARRREVARLTERLRTPETGATSDPRAAALAGLPIPRGARPPTVRRGFRASPCLHATLRRLADCEAAGAEAEERGAEARGGEAALPEATLARWSLYLARDAEETPRVRGALIVGARALLDTTDGDPHGEGGDARSRRWRRVGAELARARRLAWRA